MLDLHDVFRDEFVSVFFIALPELLFEADQLFVGFLLLIR
jgi:hypothetical protein